MKLFYVVEDELDLFVWANTPEQAKLVWYEHYEIVDGEPHRIFEVPTTPPPHPRAMPWHAEVVQVGGSRA